MIEIIAAVGVVLIALFIYLSLRYFRKIGRGETDPVINPGWTADMRPSTRTELPGPDDER